MSSAIATFPQVKMLRKTQEQGGNNKASDSPADAEVEVTIVRRMDANLMRSQHEGAVLSPCSWAGAACVAGCHWGIHGRVEQSPAKIVYDGDLSLCYPPPDDTVY